MEAATCATAKKVNPCLRPSLQTAASPSRRWHEEKLASHPHALPLSWDSLTSSCWYSRAVDNLEPFSFPEAEVVLCPRFIVVKCHKEGDSCSDKNSVSARCRLVDGNEAEDTHTSDSWSSTLNNIMTAHQLLQASTRHRSYFPMVCKCIWSDCCFLPSPVWSQ